MKHIVVKRKDWTKIYTSGVSSKRNDKGEWENVSQTDEEAEQICYESLMDDIKREEFEKYLIFTIKNHLREGQMDNWTNIEINISYSTDKRCKMNISNKENMQWDTSEVQKIELPEV